MKELSTQEIVKRDPSLRKAGVDWKQAYYAIHKTIENNTHRVLRVKNTLFWVELLPNDQIKFVVLTAEPQNVLIDRAAEFAKAVDKAGLEIVGAQ